MSNSLLVLLIKIVYLIFAFVLVLQSCHKFCYPFQILIQSVCETMVPKLVAEDIPLLFSLLSDVFPGIEYTRAQMTGLKEEIRKVRFLLVQYPDSF